MTHSSNNDGRARTLAILVFFLAFIVICLDVAYGAEMTVEQAIEEAKDEQSICLALGGTETECGDVFNAVLDEHLDWSAVSADWPMDRDSEDDPIGALIERL